MLDILRIIYFTIKITPCLNQSQFFFSLREACDDIMIRTVLTTTDLRLNLNRLLKIPQKLGKIKSCNPTFTAFRRVKHAIVQSCNQIVIIRTGQNDVIMWV